MKAKYDLKAQRDAFMVSMQNDIRLKEYPRSDHKNYFNQYAAKQIFREKWDSYAFRFCFNASLPVIMFFSDIYFPLKNIFTCLNKKRIDFGKIKRLYLNHDSNLYKISKRIDLQEENDFWFKSPFDTFVLPKECKIIYMADLVTWREVLKSSWQALVIHIRTIFQLGYDKYFLSYNAYNWCLCDFALRHIPLETEMIYCSIYDRMAIMYDKFPHCNKVMIQHGGMFMKHKIIKDSPYYEWHSDMGFYTITGFYKSSPSIVYCLSENDKIALSRSVIANSPKYINIGYNFKPNVFPPKKSVMIVGNYNTHYNDECFIVQNLGNLDIELYLKNHPVIDDSLYDNLIRTMPSLQFIGARSQIYPRVDILISYDSTLAYEYESIGTKVLFYDDINIHEIKAVVCNILAL